MGDYPLLSHVKFAARFHNRTGLDFPRTSLALLFLPVVLGYMRQ